MKKALLTALLLLPLSAWPRSLELTDYLNWETVSNPQISPDGRQVVYVRNRVDKVKDTIKPELWIMDSDGKRNRFLLPGGSNPRWSPSGNRLAYLAADDDEKPQIFVRWMDAEGATTQVTHHAKRPSTPVWSPDGSHIAFRAEVAMQAEFTIDMPAPPEGATWTQAPTVIERMHYRIDRVGMKTGFRHLFVVDAGGGTPRQLTAGSWDVGRGFFGVDLLDVPRWTPDGEAILFSGATNDEASDHGRISDINRVDVATGDISKLSGIAGSWGSPLVSPNGRLVIYTGSKAKESSFAPVELRVMGLDGGDDRALLEDVPSFITGLTWARNGRGVYFTMDKEGSNNVHFVDLQGSLRQVTQGEQRIQLTSANQDVGYGVSTSVHQPGDVVRINLRNGSINRQTDVNDDVLADVELGAVEEIWYDSSDDTRVQGWIVTPPGFDPQKKYPLILHIHGGPNAMYGVNFNFRFQEFVANDYVLLYTNPRGSTGYDYEFLDAIDNAYPGRVDFDDLMAGVDAILERGYIDPERLYATGCSGGGALTAWLVTHTDRFRAAASLCPVTNWITMGGNADITRWSMERFRTPFWEDPTLWIEHSPIFHVGKVTTPTLLMTGIEDLRTPLAQAEEFYQALKYRGVPTVLIPMHKEWHGTWSVPSNMLRTQLYVRKWFERFAGSP